MAAVVFVNVHVVCALSVGGVQTRKEHCACCPTAARRWSGLGDNVELPISLDWIIPFYFIIFFPPSVKTGFIVGLSELFFFYFFFV
uniref:Putative secreted protein n=1 Tax=Ixodes scapularis TaxID=6945 RepID=A0A4D5RAN0_IXOSC